MQDKIEELVGYIQENCLWQFFSRSWDREENIAGVLTKTCDLLTGQKPAIDSDLDRCHLADAKILCAEFGSKFPWVKQMDKESLRTLLEAVKDRMREITISKSKNQELNVKYY